MNGITIVASALERVAAVLLVTVYGGGGGGGVGY